MAELKRQKEDMNSDWRTDGGPIHRRISGIHTETGADFILPDYMGDVKKLLNFSAKVTPSGKFFSGNTLSLSGIVEYSVIYLDSESKLTEAHFTSDYDYDVKVEDGYLCSFEKCRISSPAVRLAGPRKICAKATVTSELFIGEMKNTPPMPDGEDIEVKSKEISLHRGEYTDFTERELAAEAARLEGVSAEDVQVVFSGGDIRFDSAKIKDGAVEVEGAVELYAVLCIAEESHIRVEKTIEFSETLETEEEDVEAAVTPDGYISSLKVNINVAGEGEDEYVSVTFSAIAEIGARIDKNTSLTIPRDAYCRSADSENSYDSYKYTEFIGTHGLRCVLNCEFKKSELDEENIADVIHTEATPKITDTRIEDELLLVSGVICFSVIVKAGTEGHFTALKLEAPVEIKERISCPGGKRAEAIIYPKVNDISVTLDASTLFIKCALTSPALIFAEEEVRYLSGMKFSDREETEEECAVRVYYPDKSDTLWSVAKKYRIPIGKILEHNELNTEVSGDGDVSLSGKDILLIIKS